MSATRSTGQIGIGILQLRILVSMAQLALHAGIPVRMIVSSFHCTLSFILIPRYVDARRFLGIPRHSSGFFAYHWLPL
jgi:hypothetical protein